MITWLRTLINGDVTRYDELYRQHLALTLEHEALKVRHEDVVRRLQHTATTHKDVPLAGFDDLTVEPRFGETRQAYIGMVGEFFETVLHTKLKVSIAEIRDLLSNIGRQEGTPLHLSRTEYDFFLRGMEAGLWKIHDWCTNLQAERRQSLQDKENDNGSI